MQGFKTFLLRGNLIELAVAFVMGLAFNTVVQSLAEVLMGFVGKLFGEPDFSEVTLYGVVVGEFINALISFVLLATVIYFFVIVPYTKVKERLFPTPPQEPPGTPEDIALLREIRDALRSPAAGSTGPGDAGTT